jgi:hypothetical protein
MGCELIVGVVVFLLSSFLAVLESSLVGVRMKGGGDAFVRSPPLEISCNTSSFGDKKRFLGAW